MNVSVKLVRLASTVSFIRKVIEDRDFLILTSFKDGISQKKIAEVCGLSVSRVKAIIGEQKTKGLK